MNKRRIEVGVNVSNFNINLKVNVLIIESRFRNMSEPELN